MIKTETSKGRYSVDNIISILDTYSDEELQRLNHAAYTILHGKRKRSIAEKKRDLFVGMEVTFGTHRGTIVKINRTKCVVDTGELRTWSVPITMIKAV